MNLTPADIAKTDHQRFFLLLSELDRRRLHRTIDTYFPDEGELSREHYPKHIEFFNAGTAYRERCFIAANRVGKSDAGACEVSYHLTGQYPDWWEGKRFDRQVNIIAAGDTSKTVRDIIQAKLLGEPGMEGTGFIPGADIIDTTAKSGIPNAKDQVWVKHKCGGTSVLTLKSYDQRREAFQGTAQHLIWLDEEPPQDIYAECLLRTMTTGGLIMVTFTPLLGLSDVVLSFLPGGKFPEGEQEGSKCVIQADWDDAPHLDDGDKAELIKSIPPYQRDARAKGIPALGAGAIYPVPESEILVSPFEIPAYWPRVYGMDVGWNRTAAAWFAWDRETDTVYLYSEYYRGEAEPSVHADAIRARGEWIPGAIDAASRGRGQADGRQLLYDYQNLGLNLTPHKTGKEAGIYRVFQRLSAGRLKIFNTCQNWLSEFRIYRRDEKGQIVKEHDHLMDATDYAMGTGLDIASVAPFDDDWNEDRRVMGRSETTGY